MEIAFTKMNGAGNDFVLIDNRDRALALTGTQIARLCDRHRGIGADGVLLVEPPENGADFRMRYYNADGGEAEMCGNGARCFSRFATRVAGDGREAVTFETPAGVISARLLGEKTVELGMSPPHGLAPAVELEVDGALIAAHFLNTGVPHAVIFVNDLDSVNVRHLGAGIRHHDHFAPSGTNVNFVEVIAPGQIAIRTFERGVEDETLACGTGVVAGALIHHLLDGAASPLHVTVRGGDTLEVGFKMPTTGGFENVTLAGPADFVFDGRVVV